MIKIILGVESSRDDAGAAVVKVENNKYSILSNIIKTQDHKKLVE